MATSDSGPSPRSDTNGPIMEAGKWASVDTGAYDDKWKRMAAAGRNPHGEVDFVMRFNPASVLDAGCGTGRVAIELASRGVDVVGVDLDGPMIDAAIAKAPEISFHLDDLATVRLDRHFDVIVMAGNVMIFVTPGTEAQVIATMAEHLAPGGHLIAGFQLQRSLSVDEYLQAAATVDLEAVEHWSTWDGDPPTNSDDYAVLVHRRPEE